MTTVLIFLGLIMSLGIISKHLWLRQENEQLKHIVERHEKLNRELIELNQSSANNSTDDQNPLVKTVELAEFMKIIQKAPEYTNTDEFADWTAKLGSCVNIKDDLHKIPYDDIRKILRGQNGDDFTIWTKKLRLCKDIEDALNDLNNKPALKPQTPEPSKDLPIF